MLGYYLEDARNGSAGLAAGVLLLRVAVSMEEGCANESLWKECVRDVEAWTEGKQTCLCRSIKNVTCKKTLLRMRSSIQSFGEALDLHSKFSRTPNDKLPTLETYHFLPLFLHRALWHGGTQRRSRGGVQLANC